MIIFTSITVVILGLMIYGMISFERSLEVVDAWYEADEEQSSHDLCARTDLVLYRDGHQWTVALQSYPEIRGSGDSLTGAWQNLRRIS